MTSARFRYRAVDASGATKRGVVDAQDERAAYQAVTQLGFTPIELTPDRRSPLTSRRRVTQADVAAVTHELAALAEARIPLDRAFASVAEQPGNPALGEVLLDVARRMESGASLTSALSAHPLVFSEVYVSTIRAAERSGDLAMMLTHLADMLERSLQAKQQLRRALAYPTIVLVAVSVAVSVILGFVVPRFADTFASQGVELPLITRIVQAAGQSVQAHWWAYGGVLIAAGCGLFAMWRAAAGRLIIEEALLRVPWLSQLLLAFTTGRFARVMGLGLASGLGVIEAIEIAGASTGHRVFQSECTKMAASMKGGETLAQAIQRTRHMPPLARRMLSSGKDSGDLVKACDVVARHFDREASHRAASASTVLEPVMTILMAAIVMVVALAVFLPMWSMVGQRR